MGYTITLPILHLDLIDLHDQELLAIADTSKYGVLPTSDEVNLTITCPTGEPISVTFNPGNVNVYTCADLGITCVDCTCCNLPDGIYDVIYTVVQGSTTTVIEKTFIKVDQIKCKYWNTFLKVDLQCDCWDHQDRGFKETLRRVDLLINGSIGAANDCNDVLSWKLYQKANDLLNQMCCKFPEGNFNYNSFGCGCK